MTQVNDQLPARQLSNKLTLLSLTVCHHNTMMEPSLSLGPLSALCYPAEIGLHFHEGSQHDLLLLILTSC